MAKFVNKPVIIDAIQLPALDVDATEKFKDDLFYLMRDNSWYSDYGGGLLINPSRVLIMEGAMRADPGDWVIRGVKGECYPCKPDIFEMTYEPLP